MAQFPDFPAFHDAKSDEDALVDFHCEDVAPALPDLVQVTRWIAALATDEQLPLVGINYIFCSDEYLLDMNRTHLQHDYYTDIITFQLTEQALHGDLFISTDRVADNAQTLGVTFEQELLRVMIHGVLHLAGYGDKTPEEADLMRAKENEWIGRFA
jgi:probable rRNA maturation factor